MASSHFRNQTPGADPRTASFEHPQPQKPAGKGGVTRRWLVALAGLAAVDLGVGGLTALSAARPPASETPSFAAARPQDEKPSLAEETFSRVTLSAVGDNLMNFPVVEAADYNAGAFGDGLYDFTPMYSGVADIVSTHDLNFIDIETILGGDHLGLTGYPVFNSPECIADQVTAFGWNLATTATNHCLDVGFEGIVNSSNTWARHPEMLITGTFTSQEDRDTIRVTKRNGITFALLSYTDYLNGYVVPADRPWCVAEADPDAMAADVERAKGLADVVIVAMSWGDENEHYPNDTQRFYAQHLANLGVDLIIGFGPHVIQPIEWYQGLDPAGSPTGHSTLVVFSLGNFLSNQPYSYANVEGCFTCAFERANGGPVTICNLAWTPLVNHISSGWHQVFKLKDYTSELAASHESIGREANPLQYCYDLTYQIIGPSGVPIDWYY